MDGALAHSGVLDVVMARKPPGASEAAVKEHYWGQALQYLERAVEARACHLRNAFTALTQRLANAGASRSKGDVALCCATGQAAFQARPHVTAMARCALMTRRRSLREGDGDWVDKPPWTVTWGGGASVESPHFQRVHYCELLARLQPHRATAARLTSPGVRR